MFLPARQLEVAMLGRDRSRVKLAIDPASLIEVAAKHCLAKVINKLPDGRGSSGGAFHSLRGGRVMKNLLRKKSAGMKSEGLLTAK